MKAKAKKAAQAYWYRSRDDLSFTARDDIRRLRGWVTPKQDEHSNWHDGVELGKRYFAEVAALSDYSEREAYLAMYVALVEWTRGPGIESGFAEEMAKAAIVGFRAMRNGAPKYDPEQRDEAERKRRQKINRQARKQQSAAITEPPSIMSRLIH